MTSYLHDFLFGDISKLGNLKIHGVFLRKNSSSLFGEVPILRHLKHFMKQAVRTLETPLLWLFVAQSLEYILAGY